MISKQLLEILVCPENRTRLTLAEPELVERLNGAIAEGKVTNRAGERVPAQLDGGLVREDGKMLYPVIDDIPVLLLDEAIPLSQLPAAK